MKSILLAIAMVSAGIVASASPVRVIRTVETREPADHALGIVHGETIDLRVRMLNFADPVDLTGWSLVLHGQTNGQASTESYQIAGVAGLQDDPDAAAQGWASVIVPVSTWWPANAAAGRWTLVAASPADDVRIMRAGGPLTVRGTAAADAMAPIPQSVADGLRAQWLADIALATNAIAWDGTGSLDPAQIAAWFATGTVARARMLADGNTAAWIDYDGATNWIVAVVLTSNIIVTAMGGEGYQGPAPGSVFGPPAFTPEQDGGEIPSVWQFTHDVNIIELEGQADLYAVGTWSAFYNSDDPWAPLAWRPDAAPGALPRRLTQEGTDQYFDIDWQYVTNRMPVAETPAIDAEIAAATNALVQTYLLGTNAWMTISNATLTISRIVDGVETSLWSSAESDGGGGIDPTFANAVWDALATKADAAWGGYAPDGSANPDPAYMTYLNAPATMHASGFQWATYGTYSVMAESGAVAFESGSDGEARWGLDLHTNYIAFVRGSNVVVGASAGGITVAAGEATIVYPYTGGDFPVLWFAPALDTPFTVQSGVVWVDNTNGTATVTAPAETPSGFWYATTTALIDVVFEVRPPARLSGGVFGAPGALPVVYDSVIEIESGGKTYRLPAQEVP